MMIDMDSIRQEPARTAAQVFQEDSDVDLVVISSDRCVQCAATYRHAIREKINFVVISAPNASPQQQVELDAIKAKHGWQAAPISLTRDDIWQGFNPDRISAAARVTA